MMILIVVYAVTEFSIKTAILASTQMLATQNRGPFRWGLRMSLVWISKPVILCIEEEAWSLSVFTIVFVLFLLLSYFWPIIVLFVTISACLMSLFHSYVAGWNYRKIPKISPGAYIFQRPFLRGLFLEGLIFGGAYLRREICVSKSIRLALLLEVNLPFLLCFTLYLRVIFQLQAPGGLMFGGAI